MIVGIYWLHKKLSATNFPKLGKQFMYVPMHKICTKPFVLNGHGNRNKTLPLSNQTYHDHSITITIIGIYYLGRYRVGIFT